MRTKFRLFQINLRRVLEGRFDVGLKIIGILVHFQVGFDKPINVVLFVLKLLCLIQLKKLQRLLFHHFAVRSLSQFNVTFLLQLGC
jgi:hypothetical protein